MNPIVSNANKLKWKFENVKELTYDGMDSDKFTFQGVDWKIEVSMDTTDSVKYLTVYLKYDGSNKSEKNWICKANRNIKLLNQEGNGNDIAINDIEIYEAQSNWGDDFLEWSKLESGGYMKDNSIIVEIELDFKYYDFSKNISNYTDIIFNVDGTKFYVNKEILCSKSEYFNNKFIVEMSDDKELKIENAKVKDFRCFIASVCLSFETVKNENYEQLIKLAAKYKVAQLHRSCEKYLISKETIQVEKKIEYADKYNYNELMKTCIDSLKTTAQITKMHIWAEFENLKNITKLAIGKKMMDILNKLEKNEDELKCQSCNNMDFEENLHICQTCNESDLKCFKSGEEVLKIAICPNCAIKKHMRQGHVTIDFLPHFRAHKFKILSKEVGAMLENFQQIENIRKGEEQKWQAMNDTAETKFNELVDLSRRSKSTKHLQENMDDVKSFIEMAKNVNDSLIEVMKTKKLSMQENLQKMEEWIEEKSKECVGDEETVKLEM